MYRVGEYTKFGAVRISNKIQSYLRSTMGESRLSALAILSIESELVETISFDDVISEFASMKARRVQF